MGKMKVTLIKSMNRRIRSHKACVRGLGLRKLHQTCEVEDTPENMGMVRKVSYMLKVENGSQ